MVTSAQDKRNAAIFSVIRTFLDENGEWNHAWDRKEIALAIESLHRLGRTDRWHSAIERWTVMVEDEENDMHWAFIQGSIFAGHAA